MPQEQDFQNDASDTRKEAVLAAAWRLTAAGFRLVPIPPGKKGPTEKGWTESRLTPEDLPDAFAGAGGVGLLTGEAGNPIADLDLDCPEARAVAPYLLPAPAARHGRAGSPGSHWWYFAAESFKGRRFTDPVRHHGREAERAVLCELRGQKQQTLVPPSRHPSGEPLAWEEGSLEQPPAQRWAVAALEAMAGRVAAAALLARYWPDGARHLAAQALAGGLLRAGWSEADARRFVRAVAIAAGDEEVVDRLRALTDTAATLAAGQAAVTGWPRLRELLGEAGPAVVSAVTGWLGLEREAVEPWPEAPRPFVEDDLPDFPTDLLPGWMREMVEGVAETTQTPRDVAAMLALAAVALGIQRKLRVRARSGWEEATSLWTVSAQESGSRKSAVFRHMVAPILEYEREAAERAASEIEELAQTRRIETGRCKQLEERAMRAKPEEREKLLREAREAVQALTALPEPVSPRLICQDVTEEALGKLLAAHGGRIGNFDSEGGLFHLMAGRYSDKTDAAFQLYLKAWSGDSYVLDRAGRPSFTIREPAVTLALTVQPKVIQDLGRHSAFDQLGLLGRFLYAMPRGRVGFRDPNPPALDAAVEARYHRHLRQVLAIEWPRDAEGRETPVTLSFTAGAMAAITGFVAELEPQLRPSGALAEIDRWASKLTGQLVRIAAIFHVAEGVQHGPEAWGSPIPLETWRRAEALAPYLIAHARAAFHAMRIDGAFGQARVILDWVQSRQRPHFSRTDLFNDLRGSRFPKAEALDPALALLIEHGYLRRLPDGEPGPHGGRPERNRYEVHPILLAQNGSAGSAGSPSAVPAEPAELAS